MNLIRRSSHRQPTVALASLRTASELSGVPLPRILELIAEGRIAAQTINKRLYVPLDQCDAAAALEGSAR